MKEGAGFIVFQKDSVDKGEPLILTLLKPDGQYDLPKGECDDGETKLQTAIRECFEECSIYVEPNEMLEDGFVHGALTTFAAISNKTPEITRNEHTGILEHEGYKWVNRDDFCNNCLPYLTYPVNHFYSIMDVSYNSNNT